MARYPTFKKEKELWQRGVTRVAGVDEVGVGPLAGPVVAAAVMVRPTTFAREYFRGVRDSKQLNAREREYFYTLIRKHRDIAFAVAAVSARVIDAIGIRRATARAMISALKKLKPRPQFTLIDGNRICNGNLVGAHHTFIVKADEKVLSCALASIIAKVTRDGMMARFHKKYPQWCLDIHKGYGTKLHLGMIRKHGISEIHRKTYTPIKFLTQRK